MKKLGVPITSNTNKGSGSTQNRPKSGAPRPQGSRPQGAKPNNNGQRPTGNFVPRSSSGAQRPYPSRPKPNNAPLPAMTTEDEKLRLTAVLERGEGRYTKGVFIKKNMVNFNLKIKIENREGLKISKITAFITGKGETFQRKLKPELLIIESFDLPTDKYGGHIEASVVVEYKLGIFKSKKIRTKISKNF
ncbi:MAG: hypothetical protein J6Q69_07385 [Clostridia bacterium]|nr:hypothetical protein [Clostridia bacterium]